MHSYHLTFLLFFLSFTACQQVQEKVLPLTAGLTASSADAAQQNPEKAPAAAANIVFRSADGGQTWQDISAGLPAGFQANDFFASDDGLYLGTPKGIYHGSAVSKAPLWEKEMILEDQVTAVSPGLAGVFAFSDAGHFYQKLNGTGVWLPTFANFREYSIRTVFEAPEGAVFIGCDNGLFKSADHGKTWNQVVKNGWVIRMAEADGVLLCTNERGILRSTDGGEHWEVVLSEGGVGIAVEAIEGGFAAITYNTESKTRRVRISADGGITWQPIDAGLPPSMDIASIKQVGESLFCGHPEGIFRSSDQGKTWNLLLPSIGKKIFNLSVSGQVIYAVPRDGGC